MANNFTANDANTLGFEWIDLSDPDYRRWFISERTIWPNNQVKFYVNTPAAYADMAQAMESACEPGHFIYLLGWDIGLDTPMRTSSSTKTLDMLLTEASNQRGVTVRAMLYQNQMPGKGPCGGRRCPQNGPAVDFINQLQNGSAVHDGWYPFGGVHHQKLLVVNGKDGLVAFCGGMDIHWVRTNWHDVHCQVRGPAALDLLGTFQERWTSHPSRPSVDHAGHLPSPTGRGEKQAGELFVQVARTFVNGNERPLGLNQLLPSLTPPAHPTHYPFAPYGEQTIYKLVANAIDQTKRFIYLEDQYLIEDTPMRIGPSISELLARKVADPEFQKLVILIARSEQVNGDLFQLWRRRRRFISHLIQHLRRDPAAREKIIVCQYKIPRLNEPVDTDNPLLMHSKTWIFDDTFAIIGSANCNRRGYSYDTEVAAGIFDPNPKSYRLSFAHALRVALWDKHLNAKGPLVGKQDLLDPIHASQFWVDHSLAPSLAIEPYQTDPHHSPAQDPKPDHHLPWPLRSSYDREWNMFIDPDGS